ncbi:MAG: peptide/nickel transport system ATP-binding protein [Propionibacteriaceae bacterium]|nr:peptide/nickel transport system ATP-binding protein [Propionibacteriaceae bacterium]
MSTTALTGAPLLAVRDLSVAFDRGRRRVLHQVSFDIAPGQRLGLIGESGSGKSLTALAVMGLLPDSAEVTGSVRWRGAELLGQGERALARLRGSELAMIFQEPMTALDPTMKVGRQVAEVRRLHRSAEPGRVRPLVLAMLSSVGLPDPVRIADSFPHQLSGGQRQRVVTAMALVNSPDLLICDEPTTALDVTVQARVLALIDQALTREQAACLFISHDLAVVAQVCSNVLVMLDGRVVDGGPVDRLLRAPEHPYTAGLVATARLDLVEPGSRLPVIGDFYASGAAGPQ